MRCVLCSKKPPLDKAIEVLDRGMQNVLCEECLEKLLRWLRDCLCSRYPLCLDARIIEHTKNSAPVIAIAFNNLDSMIRFIKEQKLIVFEKFTVVEHGEDLLYLRTYVEVTALATDKPLIYKLAIPLSYLIKIYNKETSNSSST